MTHKKDNSLVHILELDLEPFAVQAYVSPALEFSGPVVKLVKVLVVQQLVEIEHEILFEPVHVLFQ